MVSIVFKPVKGILQMTLKISEGIKKTALFSFDSTSKKFRMRDRIVFYGMEEKFSTYDTFQSSYLAQVLRVCG